MATANQIVSVEFDVNSRIDKRVDKILSSDPITLPTTNNPLVTDYIRKIEGKYDVSRCKEDTDNAINLLYIAYNTTPQREGKIRSGIDQLMARLIVVQQESQIKMSGAVTDAKKITRSLHDFFEGWEEVRNSNEPTDLKEFIGLDLLDLAEEIKSRAERVSKDLAKIAQTYDGIIDDATKTTKQSEQALANHKDYREEIQKEIDKNNAEQAKLESLVNDLKAEITKYEKRANEYKSQAETAEQRAFIMSIVQVGAQMISSAIPSITAMATGGASLIPGMANSTARQITNSEVAATESDNTAQVIEVRQKIADKRSDKSTAEREKSELEKKAQELSTQKAEIESDKEIDQETKNVQLEALNKRIKDNNSEIDKKKEEIFTTVNTLKGLEASLKSLSKNMEKMTEKQEKQATNLRSLQMKMLEKVEAFETAKRTQAAELVKINALLVGNRTEKETIQLAIKSLELSIKALKRMREIIIEISFFFKSFADFMQQVMDSSAEQSELIQKTRDRNRLTKSFTKRLKRNTDDFFITQTAQWQAAEVVSAKFVDNFTEGWSKLNKLSGNYLTGDALKSYLSEAADKIEEISFRRKEAATAKLAELERYRDRIQAEV